MTPKPGDGRVPILYLAPWVDVGGSDTATIEWFQWIDRSRYAPYLITTQPSPNRRLNDVARYAEEVWALPDVIPGARFPDFIFDFVRSRRIALVHIMNSRLGFRLIPDLATMQPRPKMVVQLHVEEPDRSGYVKYVTTRFGNLVDRFSLSSHHLLGALQDYDIPASQCRVIYTGIDAVDRFAPMRVREPAPLQSLVPNILFCGRLCDQKDPLLMCRVAAALSDRGRDFRLHVIGDGELGGAVRAAVDRLHLADKVLFHGTQTDIAPWFAAGDIHLMTSVFEGVPVVVLAAMAMAVPTVAPALPGNVEVLGSTAGALVNPRDDVDAYVDALERLMDDPELRSNLGAQARQRVLDEFSVEQMGREHSSLYDELLDGCPVPLGPKGGHESSGTPLLLHTRPLLSRPLVSVVVPCHDQGGYLRECIASIRNQTYHDLEIIVVDDASDEEGAIAAMAELSSQPGTRVVQLSENVGPSKARQMGMALARGRYVLPVDADNRLMPDAVESLVVQLQEAGERIGFVYPNQAFFGQRNEYAMAPEYNMYSLLKQNFCDTSSLIDREILDAGLRYDDDLRWTHEDWDFALTLAECGVRGIPAQGRYLEARKAGFTRCDLIERSGGAEHTVRDRHRSLYGRRATVKARWSPALSIISLVPLTGLREARERLLSRIRQQMCVDAELIIRDDGDWWWRDPDGPNVRRIPSGHDESDAAATASGLRIARGRYVLVVQASLVDLLDDPAFIEKLERLLSQGAEGGGVAFSDFGPGIPTFAPLDPPVAGARAALGVAWAVHLVGDALVSIDHQAPVASLVEAVRAVSQSPLSWRHLPKGSPPRDHSREGTACRPHVISARLGCGAGSVAEPARREREVRLAEEPILPGSDDGSDQGSCRVAEWRPALTQPLCRYIHEGGQSYAVYPGHTTPDGCVLDYELGSVDVWDHPGAVEIAAGPGPTYHAVSADRPRSPDEHPLGYLESSPFILLDPIFLAQHRASGQQVLVAGEDDPLRPEVDLIAHLGFIEPFPLRPRTGECGSHHARAIRELSRSQSTSERLRHMADRYAQIMDSLPGRVAKRTLRVPAVRSTARYFYRLTQRHQPGRPQ
jgi:glycosyltransferase involved in cell wall biosynthesis